MQIYATVTDGRICNVQISTINKNTFGRASFSIIKSSVVYANVRTRIWEMFDPPVTHPNVYSGGG